jgi:repressor LexA
MLQSATGNRKLQPSARRRQPDFLDIRLFFAQYLPMAITRRQRQVYDMISSFVQKNGYSPSFDEIRESLGLNSLATVHKHVSNLEEKGLLKRDYNRSRSIDLVRPKGKLRDSMGMNPALATAPVELELVGRIAAGRPIEAVEQKETISLADFVRSKKVFVLEVRGDSMQDEHIMDGDYVIVEETRTAHNGEIVVALVEGYDATLKRFYREGENIRLQPSNAAMQPILVPARSVELQGKVIGVLRKY